MKCKPRTLYPYTLLRSGFGILRCFDRRAPTLGFKEMQFAKAHGAEGCESLGLTLILPKLELSCLQEVANQDPHPELTVTYSPNSPAPFNLGHLTRLGV